VLRIHTKLLGLGQNLGISHIVDAILLLCSVIHPGAKSVVGIFAIFSVFVFAVDNQRSLELSSQLVGTSLDGLLGSINGPLNLLGLNRLDCLGLGIDTAGQLVVTGIGLVIIAIVVGMVRVAVIVASVWAAILVIMDAGLLACLAFGLLRGLVLFALLGLVLDDEAGQFETHVNVGALTAGLAIKGDVVILDMDIGFRVLALLAENELGNEAVKVVLKLGSLVGTVNDPTIVGWVAIGLGTQLETEVFDDIYGKSVATKG
jgi:hypothetical protein